MLHKTIGGMEGEARVDRYRADRTLQYYLLCGLRFGYSDIVGPAINMDIWLHIDLSRLVRLFLGFWRRGSTPQAERWVFVVLGRTIRFNKRACNTVYCSHAIISEILNKFLFAGVLIQDRSS